MDPALILAMIQGLRLGMDVLEAAQSGQLTPDELKARWGEVTKRVQDANTLWEAAGQTAAAQASEQQS